jgi:hypothetical protein
VPPERTLEALLFLDDMPGRVFLKLGASFEKSSAPRSKESVAIATQKQRKQRKQINECMYPRNPKDLKSMTGLAHRLDK